LQDGQNLSILAEGLELVKPQLSVGSCQLPGEMEM